MGEGPVTLTIHGVSLGLSILIVSILLKEHKVWTRMKDRVNQLWFDRCHSKGDRFVPLENGNK